jgi:hypothetical protein
VPGSTITFERKQTPTTTWALTSSIDWNLSGLKRYYVKRLQHLGRKVTLEPCANDGRVSARLKFSGQVVKGTLTFELSSRARKENGGTFRPANFV